MEEQIVLLRDARDLLDRIEHAMRIRHRHRDELILDLHHRWKDGRRQRVLGEIAHIGPLRDLLDLGAGVVDVAQRFAVTPMRVAPAHAFERGLHFGLSLTLRWYPHWS